MNILYPLKCLSTSRLVSGLFSEKRSREYVVYMEPHRAFVSDFPGNVHVSPPITSKLGTALAAPCEISTAGDYFIRHLSPNGLGKHSRIHVVADMPANIYAWKLEYPRSVSELLSDLNDSAPDIIPGASEGLRWFAYDMSMSELPYGADVSAAVLVGLSDEMCDNISEWFWAAGCTVRSICPLSVLGISEFLNRAKGRCYFYWGADKEARYAVSSENGFIQTIERLGRADFSFEGFLRESAGGGGEAASCECTVLGDVRNMPGKMGEFSPDGVIFSNSSLTRESFRDVCCAYARFYGKGVK